MPAEPDLAELRALRGELERARYRGERVVAYSYGEHMRRVEYRDDAEMRRALADLDRRIAALGGAAAVATIRLSTSKGL